MHGKALLLFWTALAAGLTLVADAAPSLKERVLTNETAYIPAQCYTKTRDGAGRIHNPCYPCHTASNAPNYVSDADLQLRFDFPLPAEENPWKNLFVDRRPTVEAIDEEAILGYIRQSNYLDADGRIIPAGRLADVPAEWDYDGDGIWQGFVPDAYFNFDAGGFDQTPEGKLTGWRAFAYYPFPSTHWPTNGATADVLIRLAEPFRRNLDGELDLAVYKTNLAIVEALIRRRDVAIEPVDEAALGDVDLDGDGQVGTSKRVKYDWAPLQGRTMSYVGQALTEQRAGRVHLAAGLYPEGTEFLQTLRYIDLGSGGENRLAARLKEVRYARKRYWMTYADLEIQAAEEVKEKHDFPDRVRTIRGNIEAGVSNGQGWVYAGLIEDAGGSLRPQTFEELAYCVGCHSGMGVTTDSSLAFPRRLGADHFQRGWYHWTQMGLAGLAEPLRRDGQPEYAFYLAKNNAGDEFRENDEILERFFDANGELKPGMLARLRTDVSALLFASPERAMKLNEAYRSIVKKQSFVLGRDPTIRPAGANVHPHVTGETDTGIAEPISAF